MSDVRSLLAEAVADLGPLSDDPDPTIRRGRKRRRSRQLLTIATALVVAATGVTVGVAALGPGAPAPPAISDPTYRGHVSGSIPVGKVGQVTSVLSAAGSIWVAAYGLETPEDQVLVRLDASNGDVLATIPLGGIPTSRIGGAGLAFGDRSVWVAGSVALGPAAREAALYRIDPRTNTVQATVALGGRFATDVAVSSTGVWVAFVGDERAQVSRIDPSTDRVVSTMSLETNDVRRILVGDQAVVVQEIRFSSDQVVTGTVLEAIDPMTGRVLATRADDDGAMGLLAPWRGQLWTRSGDRFVRLDPVTLHQVGEPVDIPGGICCTLLHPGSEGLWFFDLDGRLQLFDPESGSTHQVLGDAIGTPVALAEDPGTVWVLDFDGSLHRIDVEVSTA